MRLIRSHTTSSQELVFLTMGVVSRRALCSKLFGSMILDVRKVISSSMKRPFDSFCYQAKVDAWKPWTSMDPMPAAQTIFLSCGRVNPVRSCMYPSRCCRIIILATRGRSASWGPEDGDQDSPYHRGYDGNRRERPNRHALAFMRIVEVDDVTGLPGSGRSSRIVLPGLE